MKSSRGPTRLDLKVQPNEREDKALREGRTAIVRLCVPREGTERG